MYLPLIIWRCVCSKIGQALVVNVDVNNDAIINVLLQKWDFKVILMSYDKYLTVVLLNY